MLSCPAAAFGLVPFQQSLKGDNRPLPVGGMPDVIYFRVVHSSAGQKHTVVLPATARSSNLSLTDMVVTLHMPATASSAGAPVLSLLPHLGVKSSSTCFLMKEEAHVHFEDVRRDGNIWQPRAGLLYWLNDNAIELGTTANCQLVSELVNADDAFPDGDGSVHTTEDDGLYGAFTILIEAGLVKDIGTDINGGDDDGGGLRIRLTL